MASKSSLRKILERQNQFVSIEVTNELIASGKELVNDHNEVVRDWSHRPKFEARRTQSRSYQTIQIVPKGKHAHIWVYVDKGTKPHKIRARNKPNLVFQTGYSARTAPVAKFNKGTGLKFGAWRKAKEVNHPGIKARKFSQTFLDDLSPPFDERIQQAVNRGLDKANR